MLVVVLFSFIFIIINIKAIIDKHICFFHFELNVQLTIDLVNKIYYKPLVRCLKLYKTYKNLKNIIIYCNIRICSLSITLFNSIALDFY